MKKSQVSLFIIIGVVIAITFFLLFYLVNLGTSQKLSEQKQQAILTALDAAAVSYLAEDCTREALKSGLVLIGKQGGYVFGNQPGGFYTPPNVFVFNDSRLAHGVLYDRTRADDNSLAPLYPCQFNFLLKEPRFCQYPDFNEVVFFGNKYSAAWPGLEGSGLTIQNQLERYIEVEVKDCTDFNALMQGVGGGGLNIIENPPRAEVVFGSDNVYAKVTYPFDLEIGGAEPIHHFFAFDTREYIRFRIIYNLIDDLLEKDNTNENYDIMSNFENEFNYRTGMSLEEHRNTSEDVYVLKDAGSQIMGQDYEFRFARQNRPPILYYIFDNATAEGVPENESYDYLVIEGELINITAEGRDPDEDMMVFRFYGDLGLVDGDNLVNESDNLAQWPPYNVTAEVFDGDLMDWQRVRLFVDRMIVPSLRVYSYPGFQDGVVSIEDPVYFNASGTVRSLAPSTIHNFSWRYVGPSDTMGRILEDFGTTTGLDCMMMPGYKNCSSWDFNILSIKNDNLKVPGIAYGMILNVIAYYSNRTQEVEITKPVDVRACLPLRNPNSSAYPYNTTNAFLSNHSCCSDDYLVLSGTVCYKKESLGCFSSGNSYVLENKTFVRKCDGTRGNVCLGENSTIIQEVTPRKCGGGEGCLTPAQCINKAPFSLVVGSAWCHGSVGCENACTTEVVDENNNNVFGAGDSCGCGWTPVANWDVGDRCKRVSDGVVGTCRSNGDCTP